MWQLILLLSAMGLKVQGFQLFESGKEYLYQFETALGVGTDGLDYQQPAMSGGSFKGLAILQAFDDEVKIKIYPNGELSSTFFNGKYEQGYSPFGETELKTEFEWEHQEAREGIFNSFSVSYEDGKVQQITIPDDAPNFVKNIQRAFAATFQVDLPNIESEKFWYSKENTLYGECNIAYSVENKQENKYLLTKTVSNQADCTNQNFQSVNSFDGTMCKGQKKMTPKLFNKMIEQNDEPNYEEFESNIKEYSESEEPLSSKSWYRFELEKTEDDGLFTANKIMTNGSIVVQPFREEGVSHFSKVSRVLTLLNVTDIQEEFEVTGSTHEDLYYTWNQEQDWDSDVDLKEQEMFYKNEFAQYQSFYPMENDIEDDQQTIQDLFYVAMQDFLELYTAENGNDKTKEYINNIHKHGILVLTPFLMKMNYDSLYSMKERFFEEAGEVRNGELAKNLFRELVSATGSNPSALLVKEMVMKQEYKNDFTAARELLSIPFHLYRPTQQIVEEFKELMEEVNEFEEWEFVKMAAPLAYSTLVRRTCESYNRNMDACEEQLIKPAVEETFEYFELVEITDIQTLNKYMSMLSNMRWGGVYQTLKPIILGETNHRNLYSLRTKAIQAAAPGILRNGLEEEYLLPLIMDEYENHEVRINAFEVLMKGNPSKTTFIKIVTAMYWERDYEVFNYVYTSFEKYATSQKQPCGQRTQELARYFLKYWKEHMWLRPKYTFGISKTYARRFTDEKFGYGAGFEYHTVGSHKASSPIAIFGEVKETQFKGHEMQIFGLQVRVQGLGARVMKLFKDFDFFDKKETLNTDALKEILYEQMNIRSKSKEPLQLEIIFQMKNDIIFQKYWNEDSLGSISDFVNNAMEMFREGQLSFDEDRVFNLPTLIYEMPTDIGMPIAYDVQASLLGSMAFNFNPDDEEHEENIHKIRYSTRFNFQSNNGLSLFYADKLAFTVRQNRIYKHAFGQNLKIGAESKDEENRMFVDLDVPEQGKPFTMLMHSETVLEIVPNKLAEEPAELESVCASCQQRYVLSKGDDWKKHQSFMDVASEEWGMQAKATYFDCEAPFAISTESFVDRFTSYFTNENKTPKDLYTSLTFGLLQINSFLMYFPQAESCGVAFDWSQSSYNPVSEVKFSFRGDFDENERKGGGLFRFKGDFDLIGDVIRKHNIFFKFEYENDRPKIHTLKEVFPKHDMSLKFVRNNFDLGAFNVPDYSFCVDLTQKLSVENDKYFFLDLNSEQKTLTGVAISFGPSSNCETNDHKIRITGKSSTTEEARNQLKNKWYYYSCMAQKKSKEYHNFPLTDPCFFTADDLYTLRHFKYDIETINLPPWIENTLYKVETWSQYYLLPYWEMEMENGVQGYSGYNRVNQEHKVGIDVVFHSQQKTVDLEVQRMNQKSKFKGMKYWESENNDESIEDYLPSSSFSPAMGMLHNHDILNYCTASNKHVRTYDNVTYNYEMHDCWTLVSAHCVEDPEFAVFMKKDQNKQMALMVFIGGHKIEIIPSSSSRYYITVNEDNTFDISKDETYYFPSGNVVSNGAGTEKSYLFKIYKWEGSFTIDSFLRLTVHYDGSHVSILAPPHVKGQQCGMCGDFNRDHRYEMLGPEECQLKDGNDMAKAWSWDMEGTGECPEVEQDCQFSEDNYYAKQT